ncbi:3-hydroxyacyl-CoA dehydrogenase [Ralstonia soli]|uniref:3-hydroxyacyl-CoA dehydrogenase n=1 Tax=Ralstonia soli TaxID=2953896 RepID=A0ABT1AH03_9RALS|nr:3-hydroxyacyl-CoA dehydrogenase [Ralstonia soli]MCO5397599.1 3-hydroxyacyl-CoA dehydrogenase [Ralstonia soli]
MSYHFDIQTPVAVIGAGSMGAGIAQVAAQAGHPVRLYDAQQGAADAGRTRIAADIAGAVKRGRIAAEDGDAILNRIQVVDSVGDLKGCRLAVEAIVERLDIKQSLFKQLEATLGPDAILATNTSSISVTAVAQALEHPGRVVGWHFFNPATRMKLVEIIAGVRTEPEVVRAMHALSAAWGKTSVDAPNAPGFIVNRVARPLYAEGLRLLAERIADAPTIDRLMREAGGFAMGPFELMDLIGVEVNLSVTESVFQATAYDPRYAPHLIQQELVRSGRYGRKSGHGFYDYSADAAAPQALPVRPAANAPVLRHADALGLLQPLVARLQGAGVKLANDASLPADTLAMGDVRLAVTDGRTATEVASEAFGNTVVLLDLARDYATTKVIGAAASEGANAQLAGLAAALAPAGIEVLAMNDVAGLVVMRTVCCLANEAADVVTWSGAKPADIDTAMRLGTAYPQGPLAWADAIGTSRVALTLANLLKHYGDVRYRRSPELSKKHFSKGTFHD